MGFGRLGYMGLGFNPRPGGGSPTQIIVAAFMGQSNMEGRNAMDGLTATSISDTWAYVNTSRLANFQELTTTLSPMWHPGNEGEGFDNDGPCVNILQKLRDQHPTAKLFGVPCSIGSSSLCGTAPVWASSATPGAGGYGFEDAVTATMNTIALALAMFPGAAVKVISFWVQGEQDYAENVSTATYTTALTNYVNNFRARVAGSGITHGEFVIGSTIPQHWSPGWSPGDHPANWGQNAADIARAHVNVFLTVANARFAKGPDVYGLPTEDNLHYRPSSAARTLGDRMGDILADTSGPSVTTATTASGSVGSTLAINLDHDDPYDFATFYLNGGADAAQFEISDPFVNPRLRWVGNGTGPAAGEYVVNVHARDGAGNYGPDRTITVTQAAAYGVGDHGPVSVQRVAFFGGLGGYGGFSITADIKAGLNLFYLDCGGGGNIATGITLKVNGTPSTAGAGGDGIIAANTGGPNTQGVYGYISAIDINGATVQFAHTDATSLPASVQHTVMNGTKATPLNATMTGWGSQGNPQNDGSHTCPTEGMVVTHAMTDSGQSYSAVGSGSTGVYLGRDAVATRVTTGQNDLTCSFPWHGMVTLVWEKSV